MINEAVTKAGRLSRVLVGYARHLSALGVGQDQIRNYLDLDRRTLANLYFAAREPVPSPTKLRRLALRLAMDARQPIAGRLDRFVVREGADGWEAGVYPPGPPLVHSLPPPGGFRPVSHPFAGALLDGASDRPPRAGEIVGFIETIYGREPTAADTLESRPTRLAFAVDRAGRLSLWVEGDEVAGVGGVYEQELLKYLCHNPAARISGRELQKKMPRLKNASTAAKTVRRAMGQVRGEAGGWLETRPLRWAAGITPVECSPVGGPGR